VLPLLCLLVTDAQALVVDADPPGAQHLAAGDPALLSENGDRLTSGYPIRQLIGARSQVHDARRPILQADLGQGAWLLFTLEADGTVRVHGTLEAHQALTLRITLAALGALGTIAPLLHVLAALITLPALLGLLPVLDPDASDLENVLLADTTRRGLDIDPLTALESGRALVHRTEIQDCATVLGGFDPHQQVLPAASRQRTLRCICSSAGH
jgi:hypothetical protein